MQRLTKVDCSKKRLTKGWCYGWSVNQVGPKGWWSTMTPGKVYLSTLPTFLGLIHQPSPAGKVDLSTTSRPLGWRINHTPGPGWPTNPAANGGRFINHAATVRLINQPPSPPWGWLINHCRGWLINQPGHHATLSLQGWPGSVADRGTWYDLLWIIKKI